MKIVKTIAIILLSVFALSLIAFAGALYFIDPNRHKDKIIELIADKTGRTLAIEGEIEWGFWPRLHLGLGKVALSQPPGFGGEDFFSLQSLNFSLATRPLMKSNVLIDALQIDGLRLNLAINEQGDNNWQDLLGLLPVSEEEETAKQKKAARQESALPFAALALGGVAITDLELSWRDAQKDEEYRLHDLKLHLAPLSFGEPLELELAFLGSSSQPELKLIADLSATLLYDLKKGQYSIQPINAQASISGPTVPGGSADLKLYSLLDYDQSKGIAQIEELQIEGLGMTLNSAATAAGMEKEEKSYQGKLTLYIEDLARLLAIFESPLAKQLAGLSDPSVAIETEFSSQAAGASFVLPRLEARLLGSVISGNINASGLNSEQPQVRGNIKAEGPDFPTLLQVAALFCPVADRKQLAAVLEPIRQRSLFLEVAFDSDAKDVVIPTLGFRLLNTELNSNWRVQQPLSPLPGLAGEMELSGRDLPLILKISAAFLGENELNEKLMSIAGNIESSGHRAFRLGAKPILQQGKERIAIQDFSLQALGLELAAGLKAEDWQAEKGPEMALEMEFKPFAPRALMAIFDISPPLTKDPAALGMVSLKSTMKGNPQSFSLPDIVLLLDESTLRGQIKVNDLVSQDIAFRLNLDRIDIDRYLPPEGDKPPPTPEAAAAGAASLPLELLRGLKIDGELRAGKLLVSGLTLENLLIAIKAADGLIDVKPMQLELYQGDMQGSFRLDARPDTPVINAENMLRNVMAGPLLQDMLGRQVITGRMELDYKLETKGSEPDAMKAGLNGQGSFAFHEGMIAGVNIPALLRQALSLRRGQQGGAESQGTDFSQLSGSIQIANGLIANKDLRLNSPLLRVEGEGTADLVSEQVNYLLTATAASGKQQAELGMSELRGITVPIRVRGSFSELSYRPDISAINMDQLQQNIRHLSEQLGQGGLQGVLEGLTGGSRQSPERKQDEQQKQQEPGQKDPLQEGLKQLFRF